MTVASFGVELQSSDDGVKNFDSCITMDPRFVNILTLYLLHKLWA